MTDQIAGETVWEDRKRNSIDTALARTLLLLRDHFPESIPDCELAAALRHTRVIIAGSSKNLESAEAQSALITTALLAARSGASISLEIPAAAKTLGPQAPLDGEYLGPALMEVLYDLIPETSHSVSECCTGSTSNEIVVLIGDTTWSAHASRTIRLQADAWAGAIESNGGGSPWSRFGFPFGALAAAGLAAGEIFKAALAPLRSVAIDTAAFDLLFERSKSATIRLAPSGTPVPEKLDLGSFDLVSGGAIVQAALYALGRIPGVRGRGRVVEPETADLTNLNRYALLRRSHVHRAKAIDLSILATSGALGKIILEPVVARYDEATARTLEPMAPAVLVGVDHIPSRWTVQRARPEWLGIGATTHYSAMASYHVAGLGCAQCLHATDDPGAGAIPTVAFVSHWAGLWLASLFVRYRMSLSASPGEQSVYMTSLRPESPAAVWFSPVPVRAECRICKPDQEPV